MIEANAVLRRSGEILFQEFDDELLAVDAQAGICYSLNESAGRVWELLAEHSSIAAICRQLCLEYVVDEAVCLQEVGAIVLELSQAGLVEIDNDAAR